MSKVQRLVSTALPLVLLGVAAYVLHRELSHVHRHDVSAGLAAVSSGRVLLALVVTVVNYVALTLYDVLALGHAGHRLPYPRVGFTSFVGYAFGHNLGASFLSGGSVRYRLYSAWGLTALDVARVSVFNALTFWLGLAAVTGTSLLVEGGGGVLPLSAPMAHVLGGALWLLLVGYFVACARVRRPLRVRGLEWTLPTPARALAQLVVSCTDWVLAALVLWVLLPADSGVSLPSLTALFALAQLAGIASQVPAGLGVFETVMLSALTPHVPASQVVGMLLIYRFVYYLVPFTVAALLLAGHEVLQRRHHLTRLAKVMHSSFAPVVPWAASAVAFVAGAVLLFSGATPTERDRLAVLRRLVPLSLLEVSHLLGSLVGLALLLLARGLQRRLDAAYVLTQALLVAGAVFSVVKGVDYEEATLLLVLAVALAPFHQQFYRHTSLFAEAFSPGWLLAALSVVGASVWLGFFSYRHVEYSHDLWWRFTFSGDAPRFLRASVGVLGATVMAGIAALLRPAGAHAPPDGGGAEEGAAPGGERDGVHGVAGIGGRQVAAVQRRGRRLPDVRRGRPRVGVHGGSGGASGGRDGAGVALPRAGGPAPWLGVLLPGGAGSAAALPGPGPDAAQAGRGGHGAAEGLQPGGAGAPRPAPRRAPHGARGLDLRGAPA